MLLTLVWWSSRRFIRLVDSVQNLTLDFPSQQGRLSATSPFVPSLHLRSRGQPYVAHILRRSTPGTRCKMSPLRRVPPSPDVMAQLYMKYKRSGSRISFGKYLRKIGFVN